MAKPKLANAQGRRDAGLPLQNFYLEDRGGFNVRIAMLFEGEQQWCTAQLQGRPSPALRGKKVYFSPQRIVVSKGVVGPGVVGPGVVGPSGGTNGVLIEALVTGEGSALDAHITWFGRDGEICVALHECAFEEVTDSDRDGESCAASCVEADADTVISWRRGVTQSVREFIGDWQPQFDTERPPISFEEQVEADYDADEVGLDEMLAACRYAPICHQPYEFVEMVALGLLSKLAQLQIVVEPCEHTTLRSIYVYLTTYLVNQRTSPRVPFPDGLTSYLVGEHCPECAIDLDRQTGVPPEEKASAEEASAEEASAEEASAEEASAESMGEGI
ncbi:MAG: hypothetical protein AAF581_22145 [Planctomycetota bacterium]